MSDASPAMWRALSSAVAVSRSLVGELERFALRAHAVPELQARVPDRVPDALGDRASRRGAGCAAASRRDRSAGRARIGRSRRRRRARCPRRRTPVGVDAPGEQRREPLVDRARCGGRTTRAPVSVLSASSGPRSSCTVNTVRDAVTSHRTARQIPVSQRVPCGSQSAHKREIGASYVAAHAHTTQATSRTRNPRKLIGDHPRREDDGGRSAARR